MAEVFRWGRYGFSQPKSYASLDDLLTINHHLVKAQFSIPFADIRSAARVHTPGDEHLLLARDVRVMSFATDGLDSNVLLLLRSPKLIGPFTWVARNALGITRNERRSGIDAEAIGLVLDDPDGFVDSLRRRGVATYSDGDAMMLAEVGQPAVMYLAERASHLRRKLRPLAVKRIAFGLLFSIGCAVQLTGGARESVSSAALLVGVALGWSLVVAMATTWVLRRRGRRTLRDRRSRAAVLGDVGRVLGLGVILVLCYGLLGSSNDMGSTVLLGLVASLPGGYLIGAGFDLLRPPRADSNAGGFVPSR